MPVGNSTEESHPDDRRIPPNLGDVASGPISSRKASHRPPTPPFPQVDSDQPPKANEVDVAEDRILIPKTHSKPRSHRRISYDSASPQPKYEEKPGSRSRSSSRSRTSNTNVNTLLRLLALETARADAAEAQLTEHNEAIMTRVRSIREAQVQAEAELIRSNTELTLYKFQLDLAHKEIRRAQALIDEIEKARAEAEERAMKDREKLREHLLQRAIEQAREEGKRDGWKLGLERGRKDVWAEDSERRRRRSESRDHPSSESSSSIAQEAARQARKAAAHPRTHSTSPDMQNYPSKSQDFPEEIKISHPSSTPRAKTEEEKRDASAPQSESRPPSLAPSRRSTKSQYSVPPDGFIPTLDANAHIAMPPPHELTAPVDVIKPLSPQAVVHLHRRDRPVLASDNTGKGLDHPGEMHMPVRHSQPLIVPPDRGPGHDKAVGGGKHNDEHEPPAMAVASKRSTQISEFDILRSPPPPMTGSHKEYGTQRTHPGKPERQPINFYAPSPPVYLYAPARDGESRKVDVSDTNKAVPTPNAASHATTLKDRPQLSFYRSNDPQSVPRPTDQSALRKPKLNIYGQATSLSSGSPPENDEPRATVQRSLSNVTVPGIDVEPPSPPSETLNSPTAIMDPILLTPDLATQVTTPTPVVTSQASPAQQRGTNNFTAPYEEAFDQLPPGFIPFSSHTASRGEAKSTGQAARPEENVNEQESGYSPAPLNRPISLFSEG
ncbi:hypothetical protein H0H93_005627 [Arthromyces matolae]|nr:hypothetical protein H0H93_005627 [Arthromyces matolae]